MSAGRPKEFDEIEILQKATDVFWLRGFNKLGVAELVATLGIGRQSLYDTFGSKRDLFVQCIHHYRATQLSHVIELLADTREPLKRVKEAVRFFEQLALDKSARGCLVANALVEFGSDDEEVSNLLRETLGLLENALLAALKRAKKLGQLPPSKNPRQLAKALTNASIGMAVTSRLCAGPASIRAAYSGTLAMLE